MGCFNKVRRPRIEEFAVCFGGDNNFGDCDGMVEKKGRLCMLEWKGPGGSLAGGQIIAFEHLTLTPEGKANGNIVFVVEGDPRTMEIQRYCIFWGGRQHNWVTAAFNELRARIKAWDTWASGLSFPRTPGGLEKVGYFNGR
tara:strand:- start:206 stop:628 length:423 start_codon:yes stop_codon:yes gene_type:complete